MKTIDGKPIEVTARPIFERVRDHLLTQMIKAKSAAVCQYRTTSASGKVLRCAVGCLVTDEVYDNNAECVGVVSLVPTQDGKWAPKDDVLGVDRSIVECLANMLNAAGIPADPSIHEALKILQDIHDNEFPENWKGLLDGLDACISNE